MNKYKSKTKQRTILYIQLYTRYSIYYVFNSVADLMTWNSLRDRLHDPALNN